jgi:hypothetical protein
MYLHRRCTKSWETGAKKPGGMALKLLAIVQKHGLQVLNWVAVRLVPGCGPRRPEPTHQRRSADPLF